jgi:molybdopterin molybdotransferase
VLAGVRLEPRVKVIARPSAAILTIGDELAAPGATPERGKVRNVNLPALVAQAAEAGCEVVPLKPARDDVDEIELRLREGSSADALVVSGGVSSGARDFTRQVISRLGKISSWRIRMRPVRPFGFGRIGRTLVFALPGNPVAAVVAFELLVRPALRKMAGHAWLGRPSFIATASGPIDNRGGTLNFVRAVLHDEDGAPVVQASIPQGTHMLRSLALANCLVEVPEGTEFVDQGAPVRVRLLTGEGPLQGGEEQDRSRWTSGRQGRQPGGESRLRFPLGAQAQPGGRSGSPR